MEYELTGIRYDDFLRLLQDLLGRLKSERSARSTAERRGLDLAAFDEAVRVSDSKSLVESSVAASGFGNAVIRIDFSSVAPFVGQSVWDSVLLPAVRDNYGHNALVEVPSQPTKAVDSAGGGGPRKYTVFFGTNRKPLVSGNDETNFGADRESRGTVHFGSCDVVIPRSHHFGQVNAPFWRRWLPWGKDRLDVVGRRRVGQEELFTTISHELTESELGKDVLLFLHGYNVSFDEAAIRAAQIGVDLKVPGVTAFFSWPSRGRTKDYVRDEAAIAASEAAIKDFIVCLKTQTGAKRVHIIAHSMGNRGFLRAVQRLAADTQNAFTGGFGQFVLAAVDEDADVFEDLAGHISKFCERATLYCSSADLALNTSSWLHGHQRVGFCPPVCVLEGLDTVQVPAFNLLSLGHGYFANAAGVLHDMFDLIRHNDPPSARQRLVSSTNEHGKAFWRVVA
jgi:esterase/lipase superfamily enzyme